MLIYFLDNEQPWKAGIAPKNSSAKIHIERRRRGSEDVSECFSKHKEFMNALWKGGYRPCWKNVLACEDYSK